MIQLRPYQQSIVDGCRSAYRGGIRSALVQLATGGGKTALGSVMVHGAAERGRVCWWLTHRRELSAQASRTFADLGIPHGTIQGGFVSDPSALVQVASIQTIARRMETLPPPSLIVFDEAHHLGAAQWQAIFDRFPEAHVVGLTATPWRLDGKGLGNWFETMIQGPTVADLMEAGHLSRYRLFAPSSADLSAIKMTGGDFQRDQLSKAMDKPTITGDAVTHYLRLARGKRAVAFAVSIEHSGHVAAQFCAAGVPAEHVDGTMDHGARDAIVARFVAGETLVLTNADLLGEGFDVPAIEAAILLRPTASLSLHLQQIGRALRPAPGKSEAIILDHAGNALRHGLPDDDREWSLEDRQKRKKKAGDAASTVRQCPQCYRVHQISPTCPGCGHAYVGGGREIETVEGQLEEVDRSAIVAKRKALVRDAKTLDDFRAVAAQMGYKSGWAFHAWQNSHKNPSRMGRVA